MLTVSVLVLAILTSVFHPGEKESAAGVNTRRAEKFSILNGLSQNSVNRISMDSLGFLWLATQDGLNRFDGHTFKVIKPDATDSTHLDDGFFYDMKRAADGSFWLITSQGLNQFDPVTEQNTRWTWLLQTDDQFSPTSLIFVTPVMKRWVFVGTTNGLYQINTEDKSLKVYRKSADPLYSLPDQVPHWVLADQTNRIWVGTRKGLSLLDPVTGTFQSPNQQSKFNSAIFSAIQDSRGQIWIASSSGLFRFDPTTNTYFPTSLKRSENDPTFNEMVEGHDGNLWIGSYGAGVFIYNPETDKVIDHIRTGANYSISSDFVNSVYHDPTGLIWVGTDGYGFNRLDSRPPKFRFISDKTHPLPDPVVMAVYQSGDFIWLGTFGGGMARINLKTNETKLFLTGTINSDRVMSIAADKNGNIWVGTDNNGLAIFNPVTNSIRKIFPSQGKSGDLTTDVIYQISTDKNGNQLITTRGGIFRYDFQNDTFRRFGPRFPPETIVTSVFQSSEGTYFAATDFGLVTFNDGDTIVQNRYQHNYNNPKSLTHNSINAISEDFKGRIWVSTTRGLNQFLPETGEFIRYFEKNELLSNFIYTAVPDQRGYLWLTTNGGLIRFHPDAPAFQQIRYFDETDGLLSNEFNQGAFFTNPEDGTIYFGNLGGVIWFNPSAITDNPVPPKIAVTQMKVLEQPVNFYAVFNQHDGLKIFSRDYYFSLEFAALDLTNPSRNRYMVKLDGLDQNWIDLGTRRFVNFTNLDAGTYTLRVKASNSEGVWNLEGLVVPIEIVPPFYKARWFVLLVIFSVIGLVFSWVRIRAIRLKKRNQELEKLVEARTSELKLSQEQLIHTEKMRVVGQLSSGIAHDINNILAIILGTANLLNKRVSDPEVKQSLKVIEDASQDGAYVISQLQEFSKQAADDKVAPININTLLDEVMEMTQYRVNERRKKDSVTIRFNRQASPNLFIFGNQAEIRAGFTNLILNAIDAFRADGTIRIQTTKPEQTVVEIRIIDDAVGMDTETVKKIFEPFYTTKGIKGSGLGLSQVYGAITRHKGTVRVNSTPGIGTEFIIQLPVYEHQSEEVTAPRDKESAIIEKKAGGSILIVEDEPDIRNIYQEVFDDLGLPTILAESGEQGLELWDKHKDSLSLIISDIGLPGISGWDFISEVRHDHIHIPIIVITGWGNEISLHQIESMKVNKVIAKPFTIGNLVKEIQTFISAG